jgi:flagellin
MTQAARNANDGISLVQTAEGGLVEVASMLQRMRELAVQSANGTYNQTDRTYLDDEFGQLQAEITRSADSTQFNGLDVLGSSMAIDMQIGHDSGTNFTITVSTIDITATSATGVGSSTDAAVTVRSVARAHRSIAIIDNAIKNINDFRAQLGSKQNRLEHTISNLESVIENQSTARSRIQDADFASETANLTRSQILQQAGSAMLSQANQVPNNVLSLLR